MATACADGTSVKHRHTFILELLYHVIKTRFKNTENVSDTQMCDLVLTSELEHSRFCHIESILPNISIICLKNVPAATCCILGKSAPRSKWLLLQEDNADH